MTTMKKVDNCLLGSSRKMDLSKVFRCERAGEIWYVQFGCWRRRSGGCEWANCVDWVGRRWTEAAMEGEVTIQNVVHGIRWWWWVRCYRC